MDTDVLLLWKEKLCYIQDRLNINEQLNHSKLVCGCSYEDKLKDVERDSDPFCVGVHHEHKFFVNWDRKIHFCFVVYDLSSSLYT